MRCLMPDTITIVETNTEVIEVEETIIAVETEVEIIEVAEQGVPGDSAYAVAVANGFVGTESEWLDSLVGADGAPGADGNAADIALEIHNAAEEVLSDEDEFGFWENVSTLLNKISWLNIKSTLKTYFDTLYNFYTHPATHSADIITDGTTNKAYTAVEQTKLAGIEAGAEVNVNADWNAVAGDAEILNKPTIPSIAGLIPYTGGTSNVDLGVHNLTVDTNSLFVDSANHRVGIGTTSPSYSLDVYGTTAANQISTYTGYNINIVATPTTLTGVVSAGGSVDDGTHYYYVSYLTALGETQVKLSSVITTTTGNNTVTLTIPVSTDTRVTGRKLYRTKAGTFASTGIYLATVSNNTATSYVDTAADSTLTGITGDGYFRTNTTNNYITVNGTRAMVLDTNGTYVGYLAGAAITSGGWNSFFGYRAGTAVTTGTGNVFLGMNAALNTTTGGSNVAIGYQPLYFNQTGNSNTAIGNNAMLGSAGVSTSYSVAIGASAAQNSTGSYNTYIGYGAGLSSAGGTNASNVGIGYRALAGITTSTATFNTVVGVEGMFNLSTGNHNTALGYRAGYNITTATDGVFLGYNAGAYETGSNKLFIDNQLRTNEATARYSAMIYGEFNSTLLSQKLYLNSKVSINPTGSLVSPTAYLHLGAGTATANTAPLKFTSGTLLTVPELGTIEYYDDGTNSHFYGTIKVAGVTTRIQII